MIGHVARSDDELDRLLDVAARAARAGGDVAARRQGSGELDVTEKSGAYDLVSQADHESEQAIRAVLSDLRPDDAVLGEEGGTTAGGSGLTWVVDPIDGTTNYLYGWPLWSVSVAVRDDDGEVLAGVVLEPAVDRLTAARLGGGTRTGPAAGRGRPIGASATSDLSRALVDVGLGAGHLRAYAGSLVEGLARGAVRDLRRGGSAATALAMVATGRIDAYWGPGVAVWDVAAGVLLVREAGGVVGTLAGALPSSLPDGGTVLAGGERVFEPLRARLRDVYGDAAD
jgi:myo-inositol-1(or 4)-monophosphatase